MARCPKCGEEATSAVKTWSIFSRKPEEKEGSPKLMGIFECIKCKTRFRAVIEPETRNEETVSIKNMVEKIKLIQGNLCRPLKIYAKR